MSTASPLPLQPLPADTVSPADARALKHQVAARLAEHRQRRPRAAEVAASPAVTKGKHSRVADSVAQRFSKTQTYRDFLQQEAEAAVRQADAAAEVARRTAEAVAEVQRNLLQEIEHWNSHDTEPAHGPADVLPMLAAEPAVVESAVAADEPMLLRTEAAVVTPEAIVATAPAIAEVQPVIQSAAPIAEPEPVLSPLAALRQQMPAEPLEPAVPLPTNLIEFPRQLVAARRARPRLAEGPLREEADASPERAQLRIFEVEASSVSIEPVVESSLPEWSTIRLDDTNAYVAEHVHVEPGMSFLHPLHVAPRQLRLMAAAVDACCIGAAFLAAVVVAAYASPVLPTGIPAALSAAGTLFILGIFYQLLFFTLSDSTPGMRYARIGLCTFNDENPSRSAMRRRIGALLLAGMPAGLGILWACLDDEGLGWHDRISRMYPRAY